MPEYVLDWKSRACGVDNLSGKQEGYTHFLQLFILQMTYRWSHFVSHLTVSF